LALREGVEFDRQSFKDHLGEDNLKKLINFSLRYIADLDIPVKRGTFLEYRNGMMNISPIGRNCSKEERNAFEDYDKTANVRKDFVAALEKEMEGIDL
jgi:phosphomannomutase